MKRRSIFRAFMISVGLSAALMIVLSQNLPQLPESFKVKDDVEQSAKSDAELTYLATPTDIVPSGSAVQLNGGSSSILETILPEKSETCATFHFPEVCIGFLNVLLRVTISPNAP